MGYFVWQLVLIKFTDKDFKGYRGIKDIFILAFCPFVWYFFCYLHSDFFPETLIHVVLLLHFSNNALYSFLHFIIRVLSSVLVLQSSTKKKITYVNLVTRNNLVSLWGSISCHSDIYSKHSWILFYIRVIYYLALQVFRRYWSFSYLLKTCKAK